ncbi:twin-arginine translocation signal domain-containing protein [Xanthomonas oryzae]|uniref:twin-arginine translocation signal domain-containing protein n=1 Tax=Xanthomonas oryzae TaxID=347 RepID=UPI003D059A91
MERTGDVMSFDSPCSDASSSNGLSRRRFVQGLALGGIAVAGGLWRRDARAATPASPRYCAVAASRCRSAACRSISPAAPVPRSPSTSACRHRSCAGARATP